MRASGFSLVTKPANEPISLAEAKKFLRVDHTDEDTLIEALIKAARQQIEELTRQVLIEQTWQAQFSSFPAAGVELVKPPLIGVDAVRYWPDAASSVLRGRGAKLVVGSSTATIDRVLTGATTCRVTDLSNLSTIENVELTGPTVNTGNTVFSGKGGIAEGTYFVDYRADASTAWTKFLDFNVDYLAAPARVTPVTTNFPSVDSTQGQPWLIHFKAGFGKSGSEVPQPLLQALELLIGHLYEHRGEDPRQVPVPQAVRYLAQPYIVPNPL